MSDRAHDNLETLYELFSREAIDGIFEGGTYVVDGVEFVSKYAPGSTADRFHIVKSIPFVEYFVEFCREFQGASLFELGIAEGGSTALLALIAKPRRLVAVDLEPRRLQALDEFSRRRGLEDTMKLYYSVDQSDGERLRQIAADEFGADGVDLVLDDASHKLEPTRASFEALFPSVKPGGYFTIEDWNADLTFRDAVVESLLHPKTPDDAARAEETRRAIAAGAGKTEPPARSLSQLAIELVLAASSSPGVVAEVAMNEYWIMVKRGPDVVDAANFKLADLYRDYFGFLPSR